MNITIPKAVVEISADEAGDLFYALRKDLEQTIDTHWVNHPGVYTQQAQQKIHMMERLAAMLYPGVFASTMADLNLRLKRVVEEKNAKEMKK